MNQGGQANRSTVSFVRFGRRGFFYSLGCILVALFVTACPEEDEYDEYEDTDKDIVEIDKTCGTVECAKEDYCDRTVTPVVCRQPPTGQGIACAAQADCEEYEANYCELQVSNTCLVQNCNPELNNCTDDYHCCDFSSSEDLPDSLCISRVLSGDVCATAS